MRKLKFNKQKSLWNKLMKKKTDDTSYDDAQFHRIKKKFIDGNKLYVHTI